MSIRMAKKFCTSSEALCILTAVSPIIIKMHDAVQKYIVRKGKGSHTHLFDSEIELKNWPHTAEGVKITGSKENNEQIIQAYTDESMNVHGVGTGVVIVVDKELIAQLKFKLDSRCSNNQEKELAITKAPEVIESIDIPETNPRTVTIFTDSRITPDSLKNV